MTADFVPSTRPELPHHLVLPECDGNSPDPVQDVRQSLGLHPSPGTVELHAGDWSLDLPSLREIRQRLGEGGLDLSRVQGRSGETVVAAAAMGLEAEREMEHAPLARTAPGPMAARLTIHQGTLRSGDHLQAEGSVLVLGDVNPGARITAGGHVLVWGRLRGVAHAGCHGDATARIMALQLRPLQLRIGAKVARGPQDIPPTGFAEEARLVDGVIQIDAADPQWPLIG
jgi:septum site-determining protein MinC